MPMRRFLIVTLAVITITFGLSSPGSAQETIDDARALMQSGEYDRAIEILKAFTKENPDDGEGWTTLANAYHVKGDYESALETNRLALKFPGYNLTAKYNEACALSLLGRIDEAYKALKESIAMGFLDYDHIDADKDLNAIRKKFKIKGPPHHTYESMTTSNGLVLSYKLVLPKDFDENKIYPAVVVFPPGPGPRSADWALSEFVGMKDDTKGWIVVYPIAPEIGWYTQPSLEAFVDLLLMLQDEYSIEGKFHAAGFGTGARTALTYSRVAIDYFQSLTTFSGWIWRGFEDEDIKTAFEGLPLRLVVGARDEFGLPLNQEMAKKMSALGLDVAISVIKKDDQLLSSVRGTDILGYIPRKK